MSELEPQISEAFELHRADKTAEGLEILDRVLGVDPDNRLALFARGCLRAGNEDTQNAILDWEKALEGDLQLAAAYQAEYQAVVDKAFYDFHFETTVEPNDASLHSALGRACRLFGRFDDAVVHLTRSSDLARSNWRDGVTAAELQLKMGQTEAALAYLNGLLETRQDNPELHFQVGRLYHAQNSTAFALRHLEKSVNLDPNDPRSRQALGEIYVMQGRFDQAEPQLERSLKMLPSARAHLAMAECVRGQYRFDEALQHLRSAVELEPRNLTALTELGGLALQFGDLELGVDCLKRALEIDPTRSDIYGLLAKAAQQKGDSEEAISSYRHLLELSPADSQASHALATLLTARGEFAEAAQRLEKAREVLRDDVTVCLELAKCYLKIDRRAEAVALLKESFGRHPNHNETRALLHDLDPSAVPVDRTLSNFQVIEEHNPWLDAPDPTEPPIGQPAPPAPESFDSLMEKGRAQVAAGAEAEALKSFRAALALQPKNRDCLIETGRLYARRNMLGLAADLLQQGYSLAPTDFSLLPELVDCLSRADEMERDETMAALVLSIPADLNRQDFVRALYPLRKGESQEQLTDMIAQGILSRFPSDSECRALWESLKAAGPPEEATPTADVSVGESPPPETFPLDPMVEPAPSVASAGSLEAEDWMVAAASPRDEADATGSTTGSTTVESAPFEPAPQPSAVAESSGPRFSVAAEPSAAAESSGSLSSVAAEPAAQLVESSGPSHSVAAEPAPQPCAVAAESSFSVAAEPATQLSAVAAESSGPSHSVAAEPVPQPSAVAPESGPSSHVAAEPTGPLFSVAAEPAAQASAVAPESGPLSHAAAEPSGPSFSVAAEPAAQASAVAAESPGPSFSVAAEPTVQPSAVADEASQPSFSATADSDPQPSAVFVEPLEPSPEVAEPASAGIVEPEPASESPAAAEPAPDIPQAVPVESDEAGAARPVPVAMAEPMATASFGNEAVMAEPMAATVEPLASPQPRPWREGGEVRPGPSQVQDWSEQASSGGVPAEPYRELAWSLYRAGHLREAVLALGQALALEPNVGGEWLAGLLEEWVEYLVAHEHTVGALKVCQTWHQLYPDSSRAAERVAELTPEPEAPVEEDIHCETLSEALELLRQHPGNETLLRRTMELGDGHDEELLNLFRTLTRDQMDEPLHFRNFARVYIKLNKPMLAVVQYQKFLVVRPTADGYRELAHAYTLLNREKNAADALKKAEELAAR